MGSTGGGSDFSGLGWRTNLRWGLRANLVHNSHLMHGPVPHLGTCGPPQVPAMITQFHSPHLLSTPAPLGCDTCNEARSSSVCHPTLCTSWRTAVIPRLMCGWGVQVGDLGPLHALTSSAVVGEDLESSMECVELSIGLHLLRSS